MSNELDKHIGETLGRYESSVDAEALWQAVKPPKKRKPWLWLLLLVGVIAVAGGLWSWSAGSEQNQVVADNPSIEEQAVRAEKKETLLSSPKIEKGFGLAEGEQSTSSTSPEARNISLAAGNRSNLSSVASNAKATREKETATNEHTAIEKISIGPENLEVVEPHQAFADLTKASTVINASDQEKESTNFSLPFESELIATKSSSDSWGRETTVIETLAFSAKLTGEEQELLLAEPSLELPYRQRKASPFFVQMDAAYFGLQRALENKDSLSSDWARGRVNSEQLLEGLGADLSFGYLNSNGWQIRGGLGYTQINTLFENALTTQTVDTVVGLQMLIYNPDNSVDSIYGPVAYYETTTRSVQTYNSIRQWELPLLAGYNFELGRLTLLAEAGVRLQLNRTWEGLVLSQDLESNNFQELGATDWYRTRLGVSLQGGLQLAYPLTSHLDVLAGGSIRYSLPDFSSDNSPFMERYRLLGGQLGLRYRF